jgi:hypothetical protein
MKAGLRQRRPVGIDVALTVGDHCYPPPSRGFAGAGYCGRLQYLLRPHRCRQPAMRFPIHEWTIPMWFRHHAGAGPDLTAHQPEAVVVASTAIIACTSTPYVLPCFTGPRPRRRCAVVGNLTSVVS